MFQPRQHIKKQKHYFANKGPSSQGYGFSSGHVWMWELDWIFIGRTDAKAEVPFWPPDAKNWLIGKDPDAGKDWRQEKKGMTEDETVGWHHQLNGHEFEHAPGVGDGQGSLVCCSPWGLKESDTTEQMNWTELKTALMQNQMSNRISFSRRQVLLILIYLNR